MNCTDINKYIEDYKKTTGKTDRYTSFDYCYNYFKNNTNEYIKTNIEQSCLHLGFYLASWGMLRGSSFLLQKSVKHYEPTILYISDLPEKIWEIDVDNYTEVNIQIILKIYSDIKTLLVKEKSQDRTLVTKALLGIFGFIPAFDSYFVKTFKLISNGTNGFSSVNKKSLKLISDFYTANKIEIDRLASRTKTIDFKTGKNTEINYTKAKIIDMYGFMKGFDQ